MQTWNSEEFRVWFPWSSKQILVPSLLILVIPGHLHHQDTRTWGCFLFLRVLASDQASEILLWELRAFLKFSIYTMACSPPSPSFPSSNYFTHTHKSKIIVSPAPGSLTTRTAEVVCCSQLVILDLPKLHSDFSPLVIIPLKPGEWKWGARGVGRRAAAGQGPALPCLLIIAQAELAQPCRVCAKLFFIACLLQTALANARNSHFDEKENRLWEMEEFVLTQSQ